MKKYLRQLKTGHIYVWTPTLAARGDMVPLEKNTAKKRIEALKAKIKEQQDRMLAMKQEDGSIKPDEDAIEAAELAKRLNELEIQSATLDKQEMEQKEGIIDETENLKEKLSKKVTEDEIQEAYKDDRLDKDAEIQAIRQMKTKNQIEEYVLREYGEEIDRTKTVAELKAYAEELRWGRMQEE